MSYLEIMKQEQRSTINYLKDEFAQTGKSFDLIHEVSNAFIRIFLKCGYSLEY